MMGTILPIVYEGYDKKTKKSSAVVWLHTIGCIIGAVAVGGSLGALGSAIPWRVLPAKQDVVVLLATGIISLLYGAHELGVIRAPTPQSPWQVPQWWSTLLPPKVTALAYGVGLGIGFITAIPVGTFYVIALWALLVGRPSLGAISLAAFGLGRGLPLLWMALFLRDNNESYRFSLVLDRSQQLIHYFNGLALGSVGGCMLMAGLEK